MIGSDQSLDRLRNCHENRAEREKIPIIPLNDVNLTTIRTKFGEICDIFQPRDQRMDPQTTKMTKLIVTAREFGRKISMSSLPQSFLFLARDAHEKKAR